MLKVTITLESAVDGHTERLGHINIINTGMGTHESGDYIAHVFQQVKGKRKEVFVSRLSGWPRLESSAWELVQAMLKQPNLLEAGNGTTTRVR